LLIERKSIDDEASELFDYMTAFRYFAIDKANEFVRERQIQERSRIANSLKDSLKTRYKIYRSSNEVSRDPKSPAWFHVGKYDFNTETFPITFGDPYSLIEVVGSRDRKELQEHVVKGVRKQMLFSGAYLQLSLDKGQRKPFVVHIDPDDAERLLRQLDYTVECEVAVEILRGIKTDIVDEGMDYFYRVTVPYRIAAFTFTVRDKGTLLQWRAQ
jgi:uncharacterized protein YcgL (UPF0745 family)